MSIVLKYINTIVNKVLFELKYSIDMIKGRQIAAARTLIGWNQTRLAEETGLSVSAIRKIELTDTPNLNESTQKKLSKAFENAGVELNRYGGVQEIDDYLTTIDGDDFYLKLMHDILYTCKNENISEVLFACVNNKRSSKEVINAQVAIRELGVRFRMLVQDGDKHLIYPLSEYRYMPARYFHPNVQIIYGDKFAVMSAGNSLVNINKDRDLAMVQRNLFNQLWDSYDKPKESNAEVTYD